MVDGQEKYEFITECDTFHYVRYRFWICFWQFSTNCRSAVLEINFNMWNVMEYSIGFFGGPTMAYSVFTLEWPETIKKSRNCEKQTALLFLVLLTHLLFSLKQCNIQDW